MFKLLFQYLSNLKRPYLQNKLNIWEYRDINNLAKISHILEFIITTSTTFHTKYIKTREVSLVDIVFTAVILYYTTLILILILT